MFRTNRRLIATVGLMASAAIVATGCTNSSDDDEGGNNANTATSNNDEPGKTVTIGFSGPAPDHGWLGAITKAAKAEASEYEDIDLKVAEGGTDINQQVSQVETFINDKVDAIVLLPIDGAALTDVALKAMDAGIPVVNVDREFSSPFAARTTVLGDNYGMGVSAGHYICEQADGDSDAVVAEIAGIDSLPLTQDRSKGFKDALDDCGLDVDNRVAADFTVEGGQKAASNLLQAAPEIDYLWNHDDDQGVGVMAAIEEAGRDEFTMIGGAGSKNMMDLIKADNSVIKATVLYPATQAADGIRLARLIAQDKAMADLVEVEIPRTITLSAPVVTKDNVDDYIDAAFES
ncbi:substrate-binding domain-containing protein [Nocardioidaceae bacterium SCSIO 66511]|nr:substrate-binding domain-containing protein [Nocardioidaceae bacterium SCSIO 66511]